MATTKPQPPTFYRAKLENERSTTWRGAWAHSPEEAAEQIHLRNPEYPKPVPADLGEKKFGWSDGKLLFAHVEQSEGAAKHAAENYKADRRNKGAWSVRVFGRTVRGGDTSVPCWVVVVRHKWEVK